MCEEEPQSRYGKGAVKVPLSISERIVSLEIRVDALHWTVRAHVQKEEEDRERLIEIRGKLSEMSGDMKTLRSESAAGTELIRTEARTVWRVLGACSAILMGIAAAVYWAWERIGEWHSAH